MNPAGRPTLARVLAIGALFFLTFGLHAKLSFELHERGAFERNDLLFDADSGDRLRYFCAYEGAPPQAYPNLFTLANGFVEVGSRAVEWTGVGGSDRAGLRRRVALLVTPTFGGLNAVLIYLIASTLGLGGRRALALAGVSAFWFSNVVFGSLPDTYGVVSFFLALLFWMAAQAIFRRRSFSMTAWIGAGALATSLLTNALIAGLVVLVVFVECSEDRPAALRRAVLVSAAFVALALAAAWTIERVHPRERAPAPVESALDAATGDGNRVTRWLLRFDPVERFVEHFPLAVGTSLVAPALVVGPPLESDGPEVPFRLVTPVAGEASPWQWPFLALAWAALVGGGVALARAGGPHRTIAILCALVLGYNWAFHTVWGGPDLFLYSQNWIGAATLLVGGNLLATRAARFHGALFAILAAAAIAASSLRLGEILSAFPPAP